MIQGPVERGGLRLGNSKLCAMMQGRPQSKRHDRAVQQRQARDARESSTKIKNMRLSSASS